MKIGYAELKVRVFIININYHELTPTCFSETNLNN